ncbi:MAG: 4'-phosphopantetheinyl transferase superfamily protein [Paludibacteraceae bacterium]|nr:4'-phosphopantetheinyl transferase superfamily protein [Paludibacteraceae bacterium]
MEYCTETEVQAMLPLVSDQRREQALRYKHTLGRFCCLKSWLMLKEMIHEVGNFEYNEHGKPFLPNGPYFSISHCKAGIAVAIDCEPVGIDIESVRQADDDLIKRVMCAREQEMIRSAEHPERTFTRLWTMKEAVVKAQGTGITSFEQLQTVLDVNERKLQTTEKENYIYTIAYGKLHCFSAKVQAAEF